MSQIQWLAGQAGDLKEGEKAPPFSLVDSDSNPVTNNDFEGKVMVISVMPSIDTPT